MTSSDLVADGKNLAKKGIIAQLLMAFVMVVMAAIILPSQSTLAIGLGAAASILPNCIFAIFAFRFSGAQQSQAVAKSMVQGARFKLILAAVIFSVAFMVFKAQPVLLFCAFAITTITYWLTLFRLSR